MKKFIIAALGVALAGVSMNSYATGTATGANLEVTVNVPTNCTISVTADLAFGSYDPIVTNKTTDKTVGTGEVTTTCTSGSTPKIYFDAGENGSGTGTSVVRKMAKGLDLLNYNLYTSNTYGTVWGTDAASGVAPSTVDGAPHTNAIFGKIASGQNPPTGDYADTVIASVDF